MVGAFIPVVIPIPSRFGFLVVALAAAFAAISYAGGRRAAHRAHEHRAAGDHRSAEHRSGSP